MAQELFLDPPMPDVLAQWRHYFELLDPQVGDRILDLGCGTGDAAQLLTRIYPEIGEVVGVDKQASRHTELYRRAQQESSLVSFQEGNAQHLTFEDQAFDRLLCVDVLEWVPDPLTALTEMKRVLKPDGTALLIHSDFDAQIISASDRELTRRIVHAFNDAGPNGQIGRILPGLCRQAGFGSVETSIYTLVNTVWAPNLYGNRMAHMMADWLSEKNLLSPEELSIWLADLADHGQRGDFFYAINRVICRCTCRAD